MRTTLLTLAFLAAVPFGAAAQEQAEEAKAAAAGVESRMIDDWAYVPVTPVQGPYVTTFASSTTGIGGYTLDLDLSLTLPPAITPPASEDLTYISLAQRFDLQVAFLRRFAVRAGVQGEGIIPDSGTSAFSLVLNGNWGVGGGLVAQLISTERLMLSLTADYRHIQRTILSPATALQDAAETRRFGDLFTRRDIESVLAGGSLAYSFTKWLGLVAEAGWDGEWPEAVGLFRNEPENYHFIDLAGAVSANFWEHRFPLGVTLFWREKLPLGNNPYDYYHQYGGGIFYTGRPYLDVGIELFNENSKQEAGSTLRKVNRYYFAPRIRGYF